jgi:hypothetical protein
MKASRRDYVEIVKVVRRLEKGVTKRLMWAYALGKVLKGSNPLFDIEMFASACSADDEPGNVVDFAEGARRKK